MLTGKEFFVTIKLITGEQMMAILEAEDEKFIKIDYPIVLRGRIHPEFEKEIIMAAPFSQFSEDTSFVLEKSHVLFIKRLHPTFIPKYMEYVEAYNVVEYNEPEEEPEPLTIEEVQKRIAMLEEIAGMEPSPEEESLAEKLKNFVKGNDTKH